MGLVLSRQPHPSNPARQPSIPSRHSHRYHRAPKYGEQISDRRFGSTVRVLFLIILKPTIRPLRNTRWHRLCLQSSLPLPCQLLRLRRIKACHHKPHTRTWLFHMQVQMLSPHLFTRTQQRSLHTGSARTHLRRHRQRGHQQQVMLSNPRSLTIFLSSTARLSTLQPICQLMRKSMRQFIRMLTRIRTVRLQTMSLNQ